MSDLYIALIRHGDYNQLVKTPSAYQPFGLNAKGVEQAKVAIDELLQIAGKNKLEIVPEIDSSILLRAWQTANSIKDGMGSCYSVTAYEALNERCVGSVANLRVKHIEKILFDDPRYDVPHANWKSDSFYKLPFPGAESLMEAGERVAQHLDNQASEIYENATRSHLKIFVGHGAAFRHAAHQLGAMDFDDIAKLSMHHCQPVVLKYNPDGPWSLAFGKWKVRQSKSEYTD